MAIPSRPHLQENHLPFGFLWSDRPPQQKGFAGDLPGTGEGFNRAWFKWDLAPKRWKWSWWELVYLEIYRDHMCGYILTYRIGTFALYGIVCVGVVCKDGRIMLALYLYIPAKDVPLSLSRRSMRWFLVSLTPTGPALNFWFGKGNQKAEDGGKGHQGHSEICKKVVYWVCTPTQ